MAPTFLVGVEGITEQVLGDMNKLGITSAKDLLVIHLFSRIDFRNDSKLLKTAMDLIFGLRLSFQSCGNGSVKLVSRVLSKYQNNLISL